jgi:hypothetical protein
MKFIIFTFLFTQSSYSYVLTGKTYRLKNPEDTVVNIADGGCRENGISNSKLKSYIKDAINNYWNKVPESKLKLRVGKEVSRNVDDVAKSGEILVGCKPLGMNGPSGYAVNNTSKGSSVVTLNGTTLTPTGATRDGIMGTLIHELGHSMGLGHSKDPASVMTYEKNGWSPKPERLAQDDIDGIIYLYPNDKQLLGLLGACDIIPSVDAATGEEDSLLKNLLYFLFNLITFVIIIRIFRKFILRN